MYLSADVKWKTYTNSFGFTVMGIWEPEMGGGDINAVDVNRERSVIAVGSDGGTVRLLNYPCVAKNAPGHDYGGHSAFVVNLRWQYRYKGKYLANL